MWKPLASAVLKMIVSIVTHEMKKLDDAGAPSTKATRIFSAGTPPGNSRQDTRITRTEERGEIARRTGELPGNTTRKGEIFARKRETPIPRKNARCCEVNQQEEPRTRLVTIWVMMSDQFQLISLRPEVVRL